MDFRMALSPCHGLTPGTGPGMLRRRAAILLGTAILSENHVKLGKLPNA
jgi:hypothetical protein